MTLQEASEFIEKESVAGARTFLRSAREAAKLSQLELSRLSGVPQPNLNRIESGKQEGFTARTFVRLYNAIEKRLIANHRDARRAEKLTHVYRGFKEALEHIDLKPFLVEHSQKVLEEKKLQAARLEHLSSIDDPIVAEIIESLRREIAELERKAAGDFELHDAPLYVQRMWHALRGYRKLLPSPTADALAGLTDEQRQALEKWCSFELTK